MNEEFMFKMEPDAIVYMELKFSEIFIDIYNPLW